MTQGLPLWLFDIDGTLVDVGGAGLQALGEAAESFFGGPGPLLDLAGATDLGVLAELLKHYDLKGQPEENLGFFAAYLERLSWHLSHGGHSKRAFPGAANLLQRLADRGDRVLGLLTGNIEAGAAAKVAHFELAHYFTFGAYGSDHADRNQLGAIALERAEKVSGRKFIGEETVIVGDTPKDIACAHAIGARCLAVTTGKFSRSELLDAGADQVVASLDEVEV